MKRARDGADDDGKPRKKAKLSQEDDAVAGDARKPARLVPPRRGVVKNKHMKKHGRLLRESEQHKGILFSCDRGMFARCTTEVFDVLPKHIRGVRSLCLVEAPTQTDEVKVNDVGSDGSSRNGTENMTRPDNTDEGSDKDRKECGMSGAIGSSGDTGSGGEKMLGVYDTGTEGLVFIGIEDQQLCPNALVRSIFCDVTTGDACSTMFGAPLTGLRQRPLMKSSTRVVPVLCCTRAEVDPVCAAIERCVTPFLNSYLARTLDDLAVHRKGDVPGEGTPSLHPLSFCVNWKASNNPTFSSVRDECIRKVGETLVRGIEEAFPRTFLLSVSMKHPDVVVALTTFKSACAVSVLDHHSELKKYNIRATAESANGANDQQAGSQ